MILAYEKREKVFNSVYMYVQIFEFYRPIQQMLNILKPH